MSVIAGIVDRSPNGAFAAGARERLREAMSRDPNRVVSIQQDGPVTLLWVDIDAFGDSGVNVSASGSTMVLAGEPHILVGPTGRSTGRFRDLQWMHDAIDREDWSLLAQSQGTFCAAHWDPASAVLALVADRLGLRPIYYWAGPGTMVFSSALRILEAVPNVPKVMDVVAVAEIAGFGYPVGRRTPYDGISVLQAGEIVRSTPDGLGTRRYWRWSDVAPSTLARPAQLEDVHERFRIGVRRRLGRDRRVFAALSGGLDSRCVVSALRSEGTEVHTLNFFTAIESQDQVFARAFAERAGTVHLALPRPPAGAPATSFDERVADQSRASPPVLSAAVDRRRVWWTGDGGSVGLGHVYVSRPTLDALRSGDVERALGTWSSCLPRVLHRSLQADVGRIVEEDVAAALADLKFADPGRSFHMLLMLYEQRWALAAHFEDLDRFGVEYELPFFDADFLASVVAVPVDPCLDHGFYGDLLDLFPPEVTAVPWQVYPGHRPCPLPIPAGLEYQWDPVRPPSETRVRRAHLRAVADRLSTADRFPSQILSREWFELARWMGMAGFKRGQGTIEVAEVFERYWRSSGQQFAIRSAVAPGSPARAVAVGE